MGQRLWRSTAESYSPPCISKYTYNRSGRHPSPAASRRRGLRSAPDTCCAGGLGRPVTAHGATVAAASLTRERPRRGAGRRGGRSMAAVDRPTGRRSQSIVAMQQAAEHTGLGPVSAPRLCPGLPRRHCGDLICVRRPRRKVHNGRSPAEANSEPIWKTAWASVDGRRV